MIKYSAIHWNSTYIHNVMVKAGLPHSNSPPSASREERSTSLHTTQSNKEKLDTKIRERIEATNEVYQNQLSLPSARFYEVFLCGKGPGEQLSKIWHG